MVTDSTGSASFREKYGAAYAHLADARDALKAAATVLEQIPPHQRLDRGRALALTKAGRECIRVASELADEAWGALRS